MRRVVLAWMIVLGCGPDTTGDDSSADTSADASTSADTSATESGSADESSSSGTGGLGEPSPGEPGGLCVLAENGPTCLEGAVCNVDENFCYLPDAPCEGFTCGGAERGTCMPEAGLPVCTCMSGYDNEMYSLYCCPLEGSDPYCPE